MSIETIPPQSNRLHRLLASRHIPDQDRWVQEALNDYSSSLERELRDKFDNGGFVHHPGSSAVVRFFGEGSTRRDDRVSDHTGHPAASRERFLGSYLQRSEELDPKLMPAPLLGIYQQEGNSLDRKSGVMVAPHRIVVPAITILALDRSRVEMHLNDVEQCRGFVDRVMDAMERDSREDLRRISEEGLPPRVENAVLESLLGFVIVGNDARSIPTLALAANKAAVAALTGNVPTSAVSDSSEVRQGGVADELIAVAGSGQRPPVDEYYALQALYRLRRYRSGSARPCHAIIVALCYEKDFTVFCGGILFGIMVT